MLIASPLDLFNGREGLGGGGLDRGDGGGGYSVYDVLEKTKAVFFIRNKLNMPLGALLYVYPFLRGAALPS